MILPQNDGVGHFSRTDESIRPGQARRPVHQEKLTVIGGALESAPKGLDLRGRHCCHDWCFRQRLTPQRIGCGGGLQIAREQVPAVVCRRSEWSAAPLSELLIWVRNLVH
jgi:hypothetical protein